MFYLKEKEKLYKSEPMIIKLLNLENHLTVFHELAELLVKKIDDLKNE